MAEKQKEKNLESTIESRSGDRGSTQSYLDIDSFREGIMVLKDGSMKMVLKTSAINFELKAEIERESIIYAYQNFLNSLDFSIQIIVQSRKLDLDKYLGELKTRIPMAPNELLRTQITDYVDFVERLVQVANIMQKRFYIVIPHYPAGFKRLTGLTKFLNSTQANISIDNFDEEMKYLKQKAETVATGLSGIGMEAIQLDTQELIELFYGVYNPEQSVSQKLINISQLESEVIREMPEEMEI